MLAEPLLGWQAWHNGSLDSTMNAVDPQPGAAPADAGTGGPEPSDEAGPRAARGLRAPLLALAGVALCLVLGVVVGARAASFALAVVLAAAAAVRGLAPGDGPPGVAVRRRGFDVAVLGVLAGGISLLAATTAGDV